MTTASRESKINVESFLESPETVENLSRLLSRTDDVIFLLDIIEGMVKRGPEYADNVNTIIEQLRKLQVGSSGIDDITDKLERVRKISDSVAVKALEEKLTDEKSVDSIVILLDNLEEVSNLLEMLMSALKRGPEFADNVNDIINQLRKGIEKSSSMVTEQLDSINLPVLKKTMLRLTAIVESQHIQNLMESEIFGEESVSLVDRLAKCAVDASVEARQSTRKIGIFDIFKMLGDPDVQRTLNFAFNFAKKFGQELAVDARAIDRKKSS